MLSGVIQKGGGKKQAITVLFFGLLVGLLVASPLLVGCAVAPRSTFLSDLSDLPKQRLESAEALIDAFYSFDPQRLAPLLIDAQESAPALRFYQGWAEGGHYKIVERKACETESESIVNCAITVEDDAVLALKIGFNVTDTFSITFDGEKIVAIKNSSDDKPIYFEAYNWVVKNMPEVMTGPCQGFFAGGPTPGACARAMTAGYQKFAASREL